MAKMHRKGHNPRLKQPSSVLGIKLRQAKQPDVALIQKMLKRSKLPFEDVENELDSFFLAFFDNRMVGIGGIEIYGNTGLLRSTVIEESSRGKGFGIELCSRLFEYAFHQGVTELYLLTTTADGFFKKLGFEKIDRNKAPQAIRKTNEFTSFCPSSATCMRKALWSPPQAPLPEHHQGQRTSETLE